MLALPPGSLWFPRGGTQSSCPSPQGEKKRKDRPTCGFLGSNRLPHILLGASLRGTIARAFQTLKPKEMIAVIVITSYICSPQQLPSPTMCLLGWGWGATLRHLLPGSHFLISYFSPELYCVVLLSVPCCVSLLQ